MYLATYRCFTTLPSNPVEWTHGVRSVGAYSEEQGNPSRGQRRASSQSAALSCRYIGKAGTTRDGAILHFHRIDVQRGWAKDTTAGSSYTPPCLVVHECTDANSFFTTPHFLRIHVYCCRLPGTIFSPSFIVTCSVVKPRSHRSTPDQRAGTLQRNIETWNRERRTCT